MTGFETKFVGGVLNLNMEFVNLQSEKYSGDTKTEHQQTHRGKKNTKQKQRRYKISKTQKKTTTETFQTNQNPPS